MSEIKEENTNPHSGHRQRLKERALTEGLDYFSPHQVLELLLFYAQPYRDTNELAHSLLNRFGSFAAVLNSDYQELLEVPGVGPNVASLLTMMPDFFRCYQTDHGAGPLRIDERSRLLDYTAGLFIGSTMERFYMICFDAQNHVNRTALISEGTVDQVPIYPRLVVETALRYKAKSVVLAHNHPGGSLRPSAADVQLTQRIVAVLAELGISVLDHIIVGNGKYYSFYEKGLLQGSGI